MARNKLAYPLKDKLKARALRIVNGESLNFISRKIGISKSTASCWLRDIELTAKQKQRLFQRELDNCFGGKNKKNLTSGKT